MRQHGELYFKPWEQRPLGSEPARAANDRTAGTNRAANKGRPRRWLMRMGPRWALVIAVAMATLAAPGVRTAAAPPPQFAISVTVASGPPPLPYYAQPICPGPGYIWTPGYWAWDPAYGYFWVPGTWVLAPFAGALWTPGYWSWDEADDVFFWNEGYWGPVVGFYGGIVYGYGYTGYGYEGGYWNHGVFYYNRSVNNVSTTNITNVYNKTVVNNTNVTEVSYNGGNGGTTARPTRQQLAAVRERRSGPIAQQMRQVEMARADPLERASINHGAPRVAATPRPGFFKGRGVIVASRAGARYNEPPISRAATHAAPAEKANPGRGGRARFGATPERAAPPRRLEHAAPQRVWRPQPSRPAFRPSRQRQEQPHPRAERPPRARAERVPHAAPQRSMPAAVQERRGGPPSHPQGNGSSRKPPGRGGPHE
jgi:hypothetical protein